MKKINNPKPETWSNLLKRPTQSIADVEATVNEIFSEVKTKGDEAVKKYTQLFDGFSIDQCSWFPMKKLLLRKKKFLTN